MKIFVVSSDVFERYVYRKGNSEKYMEQNVSEISTKYLPVLEMILNERLCHLPVRVFFNLPYIMCMNLDIFVGLLDNFEGTCSKYVVLVEDCRLPNFTALHYKDYSQRGVL